MRLLFIVEGKSTEKVLYRKWLSFLLPSHTETKGNVCGIVDNSFLIISGHGYPRILSIVESAFRDVESCENVDFVFICLDSENKSYHDRYEEIDHFVRENCPSINARIHIVIQNHCIETWLLGNKRIGMQNIRIDALREYKRHYNVNVLDPENMSSFDDRPVGLFTKKYLKLMLRNKNIIYSTRNVRHVARKSFFDQLVKRFEDEDHLKSFGMFLEIMKQIQLENQ